jgi:hypothetical protein
MTILTRMEKHLMGISKLLSYYGRFILVNPIYSAMPNFYMSTSKVPGEVLAQIDKYLKHCLWNGGDINRKGGFLVAWKNACRSKEEGGLGILIKPQDA